MRNPALYIAPSDLGGRGVFAGAPIKKGDLIEICPCIVLKEGEMEILDKTTLYDSLFPLGRQSRAMRCSFGFWLIVQPFCPF